MMSSYILDIIADSHRPSQIQHIGRSVELTAPRGIRRDHRYSLPFLISMQLAATKSPFSANISLPTFEEARIPRDARLRNATGCYYVGNLSPMKTKSMSFLHIIKCEALSSDPPLLQKKLLGQLASNLA